MADKGQKTEQPTQRHLEKARREGRFPVSREFVSALQFLAFTMLLAWAGQKTLGRMFESTRQLLTGAFRTELNRAEAVRIFRDLLYHDLAPLGLLGGVLVAVTVAAQLGTTRFGVTAKRLAPDLSRLNPLNRLRNFPRQQLTSFWQAVVLLPLFAAAVYVVVRDSLPVAERLPLESAATGSRQLASALLDLLWKASGVFLALGVVDLFREQRRHMADLRMTRQEIRDETKEVEGNPQVKARIRRIQRDLSRRRMMQQVPTATAVIVNPTHYAVAIRYRMEVMAAPTVVAKGKNFLARRIREKAIEHQVPIVENPPLAQSLYKSTEVGQEIPAQLYHAVAEILAYIYRLMNGRLPG